MVAELSVTLSLFTFGNSLMVNHTALKQMDAAHVAGWHQKSASDATFMLANPTTVDSASPGPNWVTGLASRPWDYVTIQPFRNTIEADVAAARQIVQTAFGSKLVVYLTWPVRTTTNSTVTYETAWTRDYASSADYGRFCQDFQIDLVQEFPDATIVRAGAALAVIDVWARDGKIPNVTSAWDFYGDTIHLHPAGGLLVACCFHVALHGTYPPMPAAYAYLPTSLTDKIREAAWLAQTYSPTITFNPLHVDDPLPGSRLEIQTTTDLITWTTELTQLATNPLNSESLPPRLFFRLRF